MRECESDRECHEMESRSTHGKLARLNGLFLVYLAALACFDCAVGIELATVKDHVERGTTSRGLVYVPRTQPEKKKLLVLLWFMDGTDSAKQVFSHPMRWTMLVQNNHPIHNQDPSMLLCAFSTGKKSQTQAPDLVRQSITLRQGCACLMPL